MFVRYKNEVVNLNCASKFNTGENSDDKNRIYFTGINGDVYFTWLEFTTEQKAEVALDMILNAILNKWDLLTIEFKDETKV